MIILNPRCNTTVLCFLSRVTFTLTFNTASPLKQSSLSRYSLVCVHAFTAPLGRLATNFKNPHHAPSQGFAEL